MDARLAICVYLGNVGEATLADIDRVVFYDCADEHALSLVIESLLADGSIRIKSGKYSLVLDDNSE